MLWTAQPGPGSSVTRSQYNIKRMSIKIARPSDCAAGLQGLSEENRELDSFALLSVCSLASRRN